MNPPPQKYFFLAELWFFIGRSWCLFLKIAPMRRGIVPEGLLQLYSPTPQGVDDDKENNWFGTCVVKQTNSPSCGHVFWLRPKQLVWVISRFLCGLLVALAYKRGSQNFSRESPDQILELFRTNGKHEEHARERGLGRTTQQENSLSRTWLVACLGTEPMVQQRTISIGGFPPVA